MPGAVRRRLRGWRPGSAPSGAQRTSDSRHAGAQAPPCPSRGTRGCGGAIFDRPRTPVRERRGSCRSCLAGGCLAGGPLGRSRVIPPLARRMGVLAASFFLLVSGLPTGGPGPARAAGTVSLSALGAPHTQDFNTLANSGTSNTVPTGWDISESGTNANTTYTAGTGAATRGTPTASAPRPAPSEHSVVSVAAVSSHSSAPSSRTTLAARSRRSPLPTQANSGGSVRTRAGARPTASTSS